MTRATLITPTGVIVAELEVTQREGSKLRGTIIVDRFPSSLRKALADLFEIVDTNVHSLWDAYQEIVDAWELELRSEQASVKVRSLFVSPDGFFELEVPDGVPSVWCET